MTKASDEKIIAALLDGGTIKNAATALDISERTIYDRMTTGGFQELYKNAKADLLRAAVIKINSHLQAAIDTAAEIMTDKDNNPAIRLQAAQTILNSAGKFAQRLQADESGILSQHESNIFDVI